MAHEDERSCESPTINLPGGECKKLSSPSRPCGPFAADIFPSGPPADQATRGHLRVTRRRHAEPGHSVCICASAARDHQVDAIPALLLQPPRVEKPPNAKRQFLNKLIRRI